MKKIIMILIAFTLFSCADKKIEQDKVDTVDTVDTVETQSGYMTISEDVVSNWDDVNNIDSPAFYKDGDKSYIVATSKDKDYLQIYDAITLQEIKKIGESGSGKTQFSRPNGIWITDNLMLIVERDNHRVQVFTLPDYKHVGYIGQDKLLKPYGLSVHKKGEEYSLFVTDDFESDEDKEPNIEVLDKRVKEFTFTYKNNKLDSKFIRNIGETKGNGRLFVVESIYADPENNQLLISDESNLNKNIKIYDLEKGTFIKNIGTGLFKYQAEGIALYDCGNGAGYWFTTDQDKGNNTVHVFSRKSLEYITSFKTKVTQNTDGVWITQLPVGKYKEGQFIMVNDDGGVSTFSLSGLFKTLNISCN